MSIIKRTLLFLLLLSAPCSYATTRYVAASAGVFSGGTNCNGHTAITPATFSSTTLAAGDITYICGTITGASNSTPFTISNNGTSANPIQLIWDTGAIVQAPYCNVNVGCLNLNGSSWIVVDGGTNGIIQNTANGTSLANKQSSRLIYNPGDNNTIKNLSMLNVYVHTSGDTGGDSTYGVYARGLSNFHFGPNNTMSQADVCLIFLWDGGESNLTIDGNHFTGCNQDIEQGTSNAGVTSFTNTTVSNNTADNWSNWDTATNDYHHNFYHPFTNIPGSSLVGTLQVYNNKLEGDIGQNSTSFIFIENNNGGSGGTMAPFYIFNNIFHKTNHVGTGGSGLVAPTSDNGYLINNTFYDDDTSGNSYIAFHPYSGGWHSENNIFVQNGMFVLVDVNLSTTNFNDYYLGQQSNPWRYVSTNAANLAAWRTACSCDANAISTNPNLNTTTWVPNSGSPVIGTGTNLTSLGITALNTDYYGNPRPSSGAWDMGAVETGGSTPAATPTFSPVAGTYTGTQSVAISTTAGGVICYTTNGTTPATNGTTGCTTGTLYSSAVSVASSLTLKAIAGGTGFTNSSVASAAYTITVSAPTAPTLLKAVVQ